jgi:hypothetical protein
VARLQGLVLLLAVLVLALPAPLEGSAALLACLVVLAACAAQVRPVLLAVPSRPGLVRLCAYRVAVPPQVAPAGPGRPQPRAPGRGLRAVRS